MHRETSRRLQYINAALFFASALVYVWAENWPAACASIGAAFGWLCAANY